MRLSRLECWEAGRPGRFISSSSPGSGPDRKHRLRRPAGRKSPLEKRRGVERWPTSGGRGRAPGLGAPELQGQVRFLAGHPPCDRYPLVGQPRREPRQDRQRRLRPANSARHIACVGKCGCESLLRASRGITAFQSTARFGPVTGSNPTPAATRPVPPVPNDSDRRFEFPSSAGRSFRSSDLEHRSKVAGARKTQKRARRRNELRRNELRRREPDRKGPRSQPACARETTRAHLILARS